MKPEQAAKPGRRDFLRFASVGAVAGTVAAATGATVRDAAAATEEPTKGYRETDHVKKVYELARF